MNPINPTDYLSVYLPGSLQSEYSINNSTNLDLSDIFQSNMGVTPPGSPKNNLSFEPLPSNGVAFPSLGNGMNVPPPVLIPPPPVQTTNGMKSRTKTCAICHETKVNKRWYRIQGLEDGAVWRCQVCYDRAREMKHTCAICNKTKVHKQWYKIQGLDDLAAWQCHTCQW